MPGRPLPSDIGGTRRGQPIPRQEAGPHGYALLADGLRRALRNHGLWRSDPARRATEGLGPLYERLGYYERRVLAMEAVLLERGLVAREDLLPRPAHLQPPSAGHERLPDAPDRPDEERPPRLAVGDLVRIRDDWPLRHTRTPAYVRGKPGVITRVNGRYRNPETLAYFGTGLPSLWLYTVEFEQRLLWDDYDGADHDKLTLDVYENWIEPAKAAP